MTYHQLLRSLYFTFTLYIVFLFPSLAFGNTFDGKSIELLAPENGGRCVAAFGGDPTITRLSGTSGSINVYACNAAPNDPPLGTISSSQGLTIARDLNTGYWCFKTSDTKVNVEYTVGSTKYNWTWIANTENSGFYNVRDFGALGNGYNADGTENTAANDTHAIRNALVYVGAKLGGTLYFPEGVYRVDSTLDLPSNIVLKGTSGKAPQGYFTGSVNRGNSTVLLARDNRSLFRIGQCVNGVKFENLQLLAQTYENTNGVEAVGKYNGPDIYTSSLRFDFRNVSFESFERGLYFHAVDNEKLWQIDFVNIDHCLFSGNRTAGIVIDSFNSDWKISSSFFQMPVYGTGSNTIRGDGIIIDRATAVQISNSFGGGYNYTESGRGGTFIKALYVGGLTVINSSAERLSESISYGKDRNSQIIWGSYSNTLALINNGFSDPINLFGRVNFVSTGNSYAGKTVNAGAGVRIFSTGDRFCMDLNANYDPSAPCGRDSMGNPFPLNEAGFQGPGTIVFHSGQPSEKNTTGQEIAAIPARIKGDLEIKGNDREEDPNAVSNSRPILSVTVDNDATLPLKPIMRLGHNPFVYDVVRDERGWLKFSGTQGQPFRGYFFASAPFQIASFTWSQISSSDFGLSQPGTLVYCSDCQPNNTSCQSGGNGALAVFNSSSQWTCK